MNIFSKKKLVLVNTALLLLSGNLLYAQQSANIQVENTAKETIVDYVVEVPELISLVRLLEKVQKKSKQL